MSEVKRAWKEIQSLNLRIRRPCQLMSKGSVQGRWVRFLSWVIELVESLTGNSLRMRGRKWPIFDCCHEDTKSTLSYLILTYITVVKTITFLKLFTFKKIGYWNFSFICLNEYLFENFQALENGRRCIFWWKENLSSGNPGSHLVVSSVHPNIFRL